MRLKQVTVSKSSHLVAHIDARRMVSGVTVNKQERKGLKGLRDRQRRQGSLKW